MVILNKAWKAVTTENFKPHLHKALEIYDHTIRNYLNSMSLPADLKRAREERDNADSEEFEYEEDESDQEGSDDIYHRDAGDEKEKLGILESRNLTPLNRSDQDTPTKGFDVEQVLSLGKRN
jgi:hypothetical protein